VTDIPNEASVTTSLLYLFVEATEDPYFLRDLFSYMRDYTHFGPDSDSKSANAKAVSTEQCTDIETWAVAKHGPVSMNKQGGTTPSSRDHSCRHARRDLKFCSHRVG
jgi:hypothetical protein